MAASFPDCRSRRRPPQLAGALAGLLALLGAHLALAQQPQQEITLDAASSDFDRRNERLVFRQVQIQQGNTIVSADEAESRDLDFSQGSWQFHGNVRIRSPMGNIESDRATISFSSHRLTKATADGAPASFSRTMPGPEGRVVTATANRLVYDLARDELELAGQAVLRDGIREVSGGRLLYRISEDRLIASADDDGADRVRIVITPPNGDGAPAEAPPEEPSPDPVQAP
jgi:lipopolysaccharide transport protein LptA